MLKYLKKYWIFAILAPLFMLGEVSMDLLQPRFMSTIIDEGVLGLSNHNVGDIQIVINTGLQMIGLVVIGGFCGVMSGVFANLCSQNFGNDVRKDCFRRIMSFAFEQTDKFSTGSLVTRVTNDVTQVQNFVAQCIRGFVRTILLFGGGIFCLLTLDISFGVIVGCALPVVFAGIIFFILKANPKFQTLQKKLDHVNSVMQENVSGARVVKAYVREDYEEKRFGRANDELVGTQLNVLVLFAYMSPLINIVLNLLGVVIIYVGGIHVQQGMMTPGNIMAAITYLSQILHSVTMLAMIFQTISRGMASGQRLTEVLETEPAIKSGTVTEGNLTGRNAAATTAANAENTAASAIADTAAYAAEKGTIEFQDVSFAYPNGSGELILEHVNLKINPGETFGILGATGSGKSSLVNLIPRFYDVTAGCVKVDGVDVRAYELNALRDKVAIALQKSELFSKSIGENIAWGNPQADEKAIRRAAQIAQAAEFIESKANGYDTIVAEKGTSLSGGQKQRIAISRAIAKNAEILIFDDSTSALDLKTEAKLYEALKQEYGSVTKIIIAQRIASVKGADRIAVIENGRIAACDSHENLMRNSEIYQDIYNSQLKTGGVAND